MNWGLIGSIVAPLLVFAAAVIGYILKRRTDRETALQLERQQKADRDKEERAEAAKLEAEKAKASYDQMQEDLQAARAEMRALQTDLVAAREEIGGLWRQMAALRREKEADEAHIADWHRWASNGSQGPIPTRKLIT